MYDNVKFTGWHTGFPDCPVDIRPETFRELPFEDDGMFFLGELAGEGAAIDPRATVGGILARLARADVSARRGRAHPRATGRSRDDRSRWLRVRVLHLR